MPPTEPLLKPLTEAEDTAIMTRAQRDLRSAASEPWWWSGRSTIWGAAIGVALLLGGCSLDSLLKNNELPPDVTDPALTQTPAGALAVYNGTILQLQVAFAGNYGNNSFGSGANRTDPNPSFVPLAGLFSDELQQPTGAGITTVLPVNARSLFALGPTTNDPSVEDVFSSLQRTRAQAGQAISLLRQYQPDLPALAGHMYAVEAYTEILLAELYCSGIPLSTVDYQGNFTMRPGSTTEEVLTHALALLDTGLTLAADSTRFMNLIRVAQGRTKLALGQYAAAAAVVAVVPDDYSYAVSYGTQSNLTTTDGHDERNFAARWAQTGTTPWVGLSVGNLEGGNGMAFISSGDPRTTVTQVTVTGSLGFTGYRANKYATTGATPIVLASGVEARLIQAEAQLAAHDPAWLTTLNTLRTDGLSDPPDTLIDTLGVTGCSPTSMCGASPASNVITKGQPANYPPAGYAVAFADTTAPAPTGIQAYCQSASWYKPCTQGDSMVVYTYVKPRFWHAGTGGVGGLDTLTDPGASLSGAAADSARVDLVFRERAFWLFLTGHRQGDLRRLVRQYHRTEDEVYPTGLYPILGNLYGTDVTLPITTQEMTTNPLFTGCASDGA